MPEKVYNPILIVSSPRSGSSCIAGILHYLGVDLGEYYLCPDTQNPTGYFEDAKLLELEFKYYESDRDKWRELFKKYIESRPKNQAWGWKSPTLSVTISEVHKGLVEMGIEPKYLFVRRGVDKLESDMKKHQGRKEVMNDIIYQQENIQKNLPEGSLVVDYETAIDNPKGVVRDIIYHFNLKPTGRQVTRAILSVIQPPPKEGEQVRAVASSLYKYE